MISTLNKLPHVKPDLVRTDGDNWENWKMGDVMNNLQGWLKKNRMEEQPGTIRENQKEIHWCTAKGDDKSTRNHLCPGLNTVTTIFTIFHLATNLTKIAIFRNSRKFSLFP